MAELDISGNSVQLDCSVDSGICVDVATKDLKMKLQEFKRILFILERDKEAMRLLRDRLSRIAERRSAKKKKDGQTVCNVCFTQIDIDDSKTCIACCSCAKNVCRGDKCSEWIPKEGEWQCQLCAAQRDSYGKASTWVEEQNAVKRASHAEFSYGMRARSEIYIPVCDPNESAFLCNFESVSEAASPVHPIQKKHIREYIEEVLADMIGGSLESATVEPIAMTNSNYQQVRNGHELQGISNVRLRRLIESIIAETVCQPPFSSAGLITTTSIDSNDVGVDGREVLPMNGNGNICNGNGGQYFESKKYQDLLATAVLNKIVNTHGNGRHSESSPDLTTSSVLDNNHNALNLTKTDESISSSSSVEPRSESSLTDPILNINKNDELSPNIKYENFYDDAANDNIDADRESVLSDFISSHMVPLPHISTEPASDDDEEDEDEDFISVTSSRDATWEDNWLFKKKKSNKTSSSVGMLVPAPKEDVRTLIGDKPTDEVSDLSEVGSDTDDSSLEMVSASLEPMNDRLVNKHLIGGKNTKVILDELVDRTSMISTSSLPDNVPPYTETKNEFVVSNDGLNESSQPLKIPVNNCTKAISNEAINSNVSKPITVNKVEKHVKDADVPEDESIVPPPNDFTDDEKMRNLLAKFNEEQNNKADSGDDNSSSLSPRSSISCALSAGIDRAELDAYEGITDFSVEDEEGLASEIDAAMGESSSRRPSVIEILAAIALGPMLAVSASDDRNILTEVELSSLMELNELAMAQMGSKSPEDRRLDVIAEESFDSNTPDERKMDFVDVNEEDDLLSSPKMVMDAIRELVGKDAVRFRRNEESSIQIEEITGISEDFIAGCEIDVSPKEGCTITEIDDESAEGQSNVKTIEEEVQQQVPELKEEIAIEEINDNATVSLSEDLGFEKIIPDNTSSISDESLHTIGSSTDGSDFEGDTTCFSCDDKNTSIKDGNPVDEFILRPPTAFCDEQSRMDIECVATRATDAHINPDTVETNEQITTENETHTEQTQKETVANDDKAISYLSKEIKEVQENVSTFETVVEVHHHSEERTEITEDNQNISEPGAMHGDESHVKEGTQQSENSEKPEASLSLETVSSAELIDEKTSQENEIKATKTNVDELHESAEETDDKIVIAPPPLKVLSEAQLNEDQLNSIKVSEEISTSTATDKLEVLEGIPVEESVSDKSTEEDKPQQQITDNLETNVDSEENISRPDETAIGTQSEEQVTEKVGGNEELEVESVASNEKNVEHVSTELSDIESTPEEGSLAPEKNEINDPMSKEMKVLVPNENKSSKVSEKVIKEEETSQEDQSSESQVLNNPIEEESLSIDSDQDNKEKTEEVSLKEDISQKENSDEVKKGSILEEKIAGESQKNEPVSLNTSATNIGNGSKAIDESTDNESVEQVKTLQTEVSPQESENTGPTKESNSPDKRSTIVPNESSTNFNNEVLVEAVKEETIVNDTPKESTENPSERLDIGDLSQQIDVSDNTAGKACKSNSKITAQEVILAEKSALILSEESQQTKIEPCASESTIGTEESKEEKIEASAKEHSEEQLRNLNLQAATEVYSDNTPETPQTADIALVQPMFIIADKTESKAQIDESKEVNEQTTDSTKVKQDENLTKQSEKETESVKSNSMASSEVEIVDKVVETNMVEEQKGQILEEEYPISATAEVLEIEEKPIEVSSIPRKIDQEEEQTNKAGEKSCALQSPHIANETSTNEVEQLENTVENQNGEAETERERVSVPEENPCSIDESETLNVTVETESVLHPEEQLCAFQSESAEEIDKMEVVTQSVAEECALRKEPSTDVSEINETTTMTSADSNIAAIEAEEKRCTLQTEPMTDVAERSEKEPNEQSSVTKVEAETSDNNSKTKIECETELEALQKESFTNIVETTVSLPNVETEAKQNLEMSEKESIEPTSEQTGETTDQSVMIPVNDEIIKTEIQKESVPVIETSSNVKETTVEETSSMPNVDDYAVETATDRVLVPILDEQSCTSPADGKNDTLNDEASAKHTNKAPVIREPEAESKNGTPANEQPQLEPAVEISPIEEQTPINLTDSSISEEQLSKAEEAKCEEQQSDKKQSALEKIDEISNPQEILEKSVAEPSSTGMSELPTTVPDTNENQSNNDNATKMDETTSIKKITIDILNEKKEEAYTEKTKDDDDREIITTNSAIEGKEEILNVKIEINTETSNQPNTRTSEIGDETTNPSTSTKSVTSVTPDKNDVLQETAEKDIPTPKEEEEVESLETKENEGSSTIDNVPVSSEDPSKMTKQAAESENPTPSITEDKKVEEKEKCADHVEEVCKSSEDLSNDIEVASGERDEHQDNIQVLTPENLPATDNSAIVSEKHITKSASDISDDSKQNEEELNEEKTDLPEKGPEVDSLPVCEDKSAAQTDNAEEAPPEKLAVAQNIEIVPNEIVDKVENTEPKLEKLNNEVVNLNSSDTNKEVVEATNKTEVVKDESPEKKEVTTLKITEDILSENESDFKKKEGKTEEAVIQNQDIEPSPVSSIKGDEIALGIQADEISDKPADSNEVEKLVADTGSEEFAVGDDKRITEEIAKVEVDIKSEQMKEISNEPVRSEEVEKVPEESQSQEISTKDELITEKATIVEEADTKSEEKQLDAQEATKPTTLEELKATGTCKETAKESETRQEIESNIEEKSDLDIKDDKESIPAQQEDDSIGESTKESVVEDVKKIVESNNTILQPKEEQKDETSTNTDSKDDQNDEEKIDDAKTAIIVTDEEDVSTKKKIVEISEAPVSEVKKDCNPATEPILPENEIVGAAEEVLVRVEEKKDDIVETISEGVISLPAETKEDHLKGSSIEEKETQADSERIKDAPISEEEVQKEDSPENREQKDGETCSILKTDDEKIQYIANANTTTQKTDDEKIQENYTADVEIQEEEPKTNDVLIAETSSSQLSTSDKKNVLTVPTESLPETDVTIELAKSPEASGISKNETKSQQCSSNLGDVVMEEKSAVGIIDEQPATVIDTSISLKHETISLEEDIKVPQSEDSSAICHNVQQGVENTQTEESGAMTVESVEVTVSEAKSEVISSTENIESPINVDESVSDGVNNESNYVTPNASQTSNNNLVSETEAIVQAEVQGPTESIQQIGEELSLNKESSENLSFGTEATRSHEQGTEVTEPTELKVVENESVPVESHHKNLPISTSETECSVADNQEPQIKKVEKKMTDHCATSEEFSADGVIISDSTASEIEKEVKTISTVVLTLRDNESGLSEAKEEESQITEPEIILTNERERSTICTKEFNKAVNVDVVPLNELALSKEGSNDTITTPSEEQEVKLVANEAVEIYVNKNLDEMKATPSNISYEESIPKQKIEEEDLTSEAVEAEKIVVEVQEVSHFEQALTTETTQKKTIAKEGTTIEAKVFGEQATLKADITKEISTELTTQIESTSTKAEAVEELPAIETNIEEEIPIKEIEVNQVKRGTGTEVDELPAPATNITEEISTTETEVIQKGEDTATEAKAVEELQSTATNIMEEMSNEQIAPTQTECATTEEIAVEETDIKEIVVTEKEGDTGTESKLVEELPALETNITDEILTGQTIATQTESTTTEAEEQPANVKDITAEIPIKEVVVSQKEGGKGIESELEEELPIAETNITEELSTEKAVATQTKNTTTETEAVEELPAIEKEITAEVPTTGKEVNQKEEDTTTERAVVEELPASETHMKEEMSTPQTASTEAEAVEELRAFKKDNMEEIPTTEIESLVIEQSEAETDTAKQISTTHTEETQNATTVAEALEEQPAIERDKKDATEEIPIKEVVINQEEEGTRATVEELPAPETNITEEISIEHTAATQIESTNNATEAVEELPAIEKYITEEIPIKEIVVTQKEGDKGNESDLVEELPAPSTNITEEISTEQMLAAQIETIRTEAEVVEKLPAIKKDKKDITEEIPIKELEENQEERVTRTKVEELPALETNITEEISTEHTEATQIESINTATEAVEELQAIEKDITEEIPIKEIVVTQEEGDIGNESDLVKELPDSNTNSTEELPTEQMLTAQTETITTEAEVVEKLPAIEKDKKDIKEEIPIKELEENQGEGDKRTKVDELPAPETNITEEISREHTAATQIESTSTAAEAVEELQAIEKDITEENPIKEIVVTQEEGDTGNESDLVKELPASNTNITEEIPTEQMLTAQTETITTEAEVFEKLPAIEKDKKDIKEKIPIKEIVVTQEEGDTGNESELVEELPAPNTNITEEISTEQKLAAQIETITTEAEVVKELPAIEKDKKDITEEIPIKELEENQEDTRTKVDGLPALETNIKEEISTEQTAGTQIESTTTRTEAFEELQAIEKDITEVIPIKEIVVTQEEGDTGNESDLVKVLSASNTNITEEIKTEQMLTAQTETITTEAEVVEKLPAIKIDKKDITEEIPIKELEENQGVEGARTKVDELPAPETNITEEISTEQTGATQIESTTTGAEAIEQLPAIEKDIKEEIAIIEKAESKKEKIIGPESQTDEEQSVNQQNVQTEETQNAGTKTAGKAVEELSAIEKFVTKEIVITGKETTLKDQNTLSESQTFEAETKISSSPVKESINYTTPDAIVQKQTSNIVENTVTNSEKASTVDITISPTEKEIEPKDLLENITDLQITIKENTGKVVQTPIPKDHNMPTELQQIQIASVIPKTDPQDNIVDKKVTETVIPDHIADSIIKKPALLKGTAIEETIDLVDPVVEEQEKLTTEIKIQPEIEFSNTTENGCKIEVISSKDIPDKTNSITGVIRELETIETPCSKQNEPTQYLEVENQSDVVSTTDDDKHTIQEQIFESSAAKEAEESDSECSFASASEELLEEFLVPQTKPDVSEEPPAVKTEDIEESKPLESGLDETVTPINIVESIQSNEKDVILEDLSIVHGEHELNMIEELQAEEIISAPEEAELKEETREEPSSDTNETEITEEIQSKNIPGIPEDPPDLKEENSSIGIQEELINVVESAQLDEKISATEEMPLKEQTLTEPAPDEKETKITEETPHQIVSEVTEDPPDSKKECYAAEGADFILPSDSNQEALKVDNSLAESPNPLKSTEEVLENVKEPQTKAQDATKKSEEFITSKSPNEVDSNKNHEEVVIGSTSDLTNVDEKIEVSSEFKEDLIVKELEVESSHNTSEPLPTITTTMETKEEETVQIVEEVVSQLKEETISEESRPILEISSKEIAEVRPVDNLSSQETITPEDQEVKTDVCQKESNRISVDSVQRNSSEQTSSEEVSVSSVVENKTLSGDEDTVKTPIEVLTATCKIITHPPLEKTESLIASAQSIYEQISEPISESSPDLRTPNLAEELRIADDSTTAVVVTAETECVTPQTISCESRCFASDPQPIVAQPTSDPITTEQHPNAQDSVQGKQTISQQARQQIFAQKSSRKPKANTINGSSNKFRNLTLQDRRFLAELEKRRKQRELIQNYLDSLDSIDIPNYINEDIYLFESTRNVKPKSSIEQSPYSLFIEPSDYCIVGATSRTSLPNAKTHFLKTKNILFSDRISSDSNRTDEDDDNNSTTTVIDTFGSMDCQLSSNSNSCEDFSPDDLSSTDRDSSATATTATNSILSTNNATTNQSHIKSQPPPQPLQPQPELRTESACSKLLVETRPTGGNEEHVDDDPLKHLVPGSIAEREYKKWYNAVDMPNNPYSVEALRRRLSGGPDRVLDLPNISPCVEDKPLPLCENTSAEADMKTQERDYARYSRDYYINDAKHASGITKKSATSPTENASPTPTASSIELEERDDSTPKISASTPVKEMCHKLEKQGRIDADLYLATPVRVIEDIPEVFAEATPTILTTDAVSKLSSETSSILTNASLTPSEDSDTIRIYDLKKQETRLVKETTHTTTITVPKSTEKKLRPTELDITPTLAAPTATVSAKSSTPTSFKFLQPKRKLINPSQVLSIDMDATPTTPSVSEKPVIEEEVVHALPSVKALAKAFLMTSTTTSSSDNKWRKARAKSPLQFFKLTTSATPVASGSKIIQKQLEPVHIPVVPVDTASQGSEDATIASDLSSLETDPPSRIDTTETTENQERVVLSGCLRNNIAFFENLKNK